MLSASQNDFGPVALLRTKSFTLTTFGFILGFGFLLAAVHFWFYLGYRQVTPHSLQLAAFGAALALSGPFGAYIMARILDLPRLTKGEVGLLKFLRVPGFALWGGLLAAIPVIYFLAKSFDWNVLTTFDGVVIGLPLAQAVGRLGCLNYGCCHGRECNSSWGIKYFHPETKLLRTYSHLAGVPVYPTQIYSALANLVIYLVLVGIFIRGAQVDGLILGSYLLMYGTKRFAMEFLRGEYPRTGLLGMTLWQWMSAGFIMAGLGLLTNLDGAALVLGHSALQRGFAMTVDCLPLTLLLTLVFTSIYSFHGKQIGAW